MEFTNIIGIDVAKKEVELVVLENGEQKLLTTIENKVNKINLFFKKNKIDLSKTLICMEHTGIYNNHLLEFFSKYAVAVWLENPIHIKRSMGMVRGKNDKIDAYRIATFANDHQAKVKLWTPKREVIESLRFLMVQRMRLLKVKSMLDKPIQEAAAFCNRKLVQAMKDGCRATLKSVIMDLKKIENQIIKTINEDSRLKELFSYATSVPNVGKIIGAAILVATNEFKSITDPRKFACHCGVAPFEYSSGTSIRGKTRVSHLADKDLKKLLHLAALGSTSRPGEFLQYFKRKVEEGKNKMLVLNAIRNKIIHRVFACVRDKKNYQQPLTLV